MKLWLDDVREAPEGWTRCYTAEDVIDVLIRGWENIEEISLDHDLGEGVRSGYDVVNFIEAHIHSYRVKPPILRIHSANPVGRKNMEAGIASIEKYTKALFDN